MNKSAQSPKLLLHLKRAVITLAAVWTTVIVLETGWHLREVYENVQESARIQASQSFEKDLVFRRWIAGHGGVYVPVTERMPPNPYLAHLENRDVTTTSGLNLTLVNPAYMTRQVHELGREQYGHQGHITSLNPIRPENAPDAWEVEALRAFERGETEVTELTKIGDGDFLRFMRPLITEAKCLNCHADQGYKEGDLRGGISVSVPMKSLWTIMYGLMAAVTMSHGLVWLLGLAGIGFGGLHLRRTIGERYLAEEALGKSEALLSETGRMAKVGGWEVDAGTLEVSWTEETFRIHEIPLGYKPPIDEAIDFFHPDDRPKLETAIQRALEHGEPYDMELRFITAKGRHLWTHTICKPVTVDDKTVKLVGTFQDVTDHKQAEDALQESEERFRNLAEMLPEAVFEFDRNLELTFANRRAFELFGFSVEDLKRGLNGLDLVAPEDRKRVKANMSIRLKGEDHGTVEYQALKKDGSTFPVLFHANSIMKEGELLGIRGIIVDITERKRAEEEKARLEEQYHQARRVESIGRLAGGVAHDLNNLLTPILGYSEMLLKDAAGGDVSRGRAKKIIAAGTRARDLVKKLLAFGRKQALEFKHIDLNTMLKDLEKLLRRTIREDIAIKLVPDKSISPVRGDVGQLELVVMNLVLNAQDAMPDGGTLTIETALAELDEEYAAMHQDVEPGEYVMLAVSDTGIGMDDEVGEHIFEPFFTTKGEEGTGLGLAMVYGIVRQHGGSIWFNSEPGMGTTFKVYIPVTGEAGIGEATAEKTAAADLSGAETILLVDDNEQVRDISQTILEHQGYCVLLAESGNVALEILEKQEGRVHMLLTDVVMPGMDGQELFARVSDIYPEMKVLYMSGYTDDVITNRGVLKEGVSFIQKPFTVQALAAKVREVLEKG